MLLSRHTRITSVGFTVGWLVGIVAATAVFVMLSGFLGDEDGPSAASGWITIILGEVLFMVGIRYWRGRHGEGTTPKWISTIVDMTVPTAMGIGFALAAITPKTW